MAEYKPVVAGDETLKIGPEISRLVFRGKYYGKEVALKALAPYQRNKREIEILMELSEHRNVVKYLGSRATAGNWYVITELCYHMDMYQLIACNPDLTERCIIAILLQISQGLKFIHDQDIIHRDMKPQNILIGKDGKLLKICDFGFSKISHSESTKKTHSFIGTENWWSPESHEVGKMSDKSDVFSLGLIFFYVLTSGFQLPIEETDQKQEETLQRLCSTSGRINKNVGDSTRELSLSLIQTMVKRKKEERPGMFLVLSHPLFWEDDKRLQFLSSMTYLAHKMSGEHHNLRLLMDDLPVASCVEAIRPGTSSHERRSACADAAKEIGQTVDDFSEGKSPFESAREIWDYYLSKYKSIMLDGIKMLSSLPESDLRDLRTPNETKKDLLPFPQNVSNVTKSIDGNDLHLSWNPINCEKYRIEVRPVLPESPSSSEESLAEEKDRETGEFDVSKHENEKNQKLAQQAQVYFTADAKHHINLNSSILYEVTICAQNAEGMNGERTSLKDVCADAQVLEDFLVEEQNSGILLQWVDPSKGKGPYHITGHLPKGKKITAKSDTCRFIFKSKVPSTHYEFAVFAKDAMGRNGRRTFASLDTGPVAVDGLHVALATDSKNVLVTWNKPHNDQVSYLVSTFCNGEEIQSNPVFCSDETFAIGNIKPSKEYYAIVWAVNKFGKEGPKTISTKAYSPPWKLQNARVHEMDGAFKLTWVDNWDVELAPHYCVQVYIDQKKFGHPQLIDKCSYTYQPHSKNRAHMFEIWARNQYGMDGPSTRLGPVMLKPYPPQNINTKLEEGGITVLWDKGDNDGRKLLYIVQVMCEGAMVGEEVSTDKTSLSFSNLTAQKTYSFNICASADEKRSSWIESNVAFLSCAPCAIEGMRVKAGPKSITVFWSKFSDQVIAYGILVFVGDAKEPSVTEHVSLEKNAFEFFKFKPSEEHRIEVRAMGFDDRCIAKGTIKTYAPPLKVSNAAATESDGIFKISWEDHGCNAGCTYLIQVYTSGKKLREYEFIDESPYIFEASDRNCSYEFEIWAQNNHGIDGEAITFGPFIPDPYPPNNIVARLGERSIIVTWDNGNKERLVNYVVQVYCDGVQDCRDIVTSETSISYSSLKRPGAYQVHVYSVAGDKRSVSVKTKDVVTRDELYFLQGVHAEGRPEGIFVQCQKPPETFSSYRITKTDTEELELSETQLVKTEGDLRYKFSEFSPSVRYLIEVYAVDSDNMDILKGQVIVYAYPFPPHLVKAERSERNITVTWERGDNIGRDVIYIVQLDRAEGSEVCETSETTKLYTDLEPNQKYAFRVRASVGGMMSDWATSNEVLIDLEPRVLAELNVTSGPKSFVIQWTKLSVNVDHYKVILQSRNDKKLTITYDVSADKNSLEVFEFEPSAQYLVEVQVIDSHAVCIPNGATTACAPPSELKDISVVSYEDRIHLRWEKQCNVSEYTIEVYRNGQGIKSESTEQNYYLFKPKKIDCTSSYFFKLTATNQWKMKGPVKKTESTTLKPPQPSRLHAHVNVDHTRISWIMKPIPVKYHIRLSVDGLSDKIQTFETEETQYTFDDLLPASTYVVAINAINPIGIAGEESSITFITYPSRLLSVKQNYHNGELVLTWEKNVNEPQGKTSVQTTEESTGKTRHYIANGKGVIVDWLNPSTIYTFEVSAIYGDKIGPVIVLKDIRMPPPAIAEISHSLDDRSITFTWKPQVKIESQLFYYELFCDNIKTREAVSKESYVKCDIKPSREYFVIVCTDDGHGQRGKRLYSSKVPTGPGQVMIKLTSSGPREVWTQWRSLSDGSKYGVQVFCNGLKMGKPELVEGSTFKTKAKFGNKYHFQVWAVNAFGIKGPKSQSSIVEIPYVSDLQSFPSDDEVLSPTATADSSRPPTHCFCFGFCFSFLK